MTSVAGGGSNDETHSSGRLKKLPSVIEEPRFGLAFHVDDSRALLLVNGEVDLESASRLQECIDFLIDDGTHHIDVDLREVKFLDSQGMALLVTTDRRLRDAGGQLRVLHPQPFIRKVFRVAGVDQFLEVIN